MARACKLSETMQSTMVIKYCFIQDDSQVKKQYRWRECFSVAVRRGHCTNFSTAPDIVNISGEINPLVFLRVWQLSSHPLWRAGATSTCLFLTTRILSNAPWSIKLLCRSKSDDQQGPEIACSLIMSTTFCFEISNFITSPDPKRTRTLQMLHIKQQYTQRARVKHRNKSQKNSSFFLLHQLPDNHLGRCF